MQKNGPKDLKSPPPKEIWMSPTIGELTVVFVVVVIVIVIVIVIVVVVVVVVVLSLLLLTFNLKAIFKIQFILFW